MLQFQRLSSRLALLLLAASLPLVSLIAYDAYSRRESQSAEAYAEAMRAAVALATDTERRLHAAQALLAYLAQHPQVRALDPADCHPAIRELVGLYPDFTNLVTVKPDAQGICSTLRPPDGQLRKVDRTVYLDRTLRDNAFTVGQVTRGRLSGRPVVLVAYPIAASASAPAGSAPAPAVGVVAAALDLSQLALAPGVRQLPAHADAGLVDGNKRIIATSHLPLERIGEDIGPTAWIRELRPGQAAEGPALDAAGIERLHAAAPVGGTDWHAVVRIPADQVFGPLRRRAWLSAAVALVALGLSGLLAWALARRTARPVEAMAAAARRAMAAAPPLLPAARSTTPPGAAGEPADATARVDLAALEPAQLAGAPREIQSLAHDFNAMLTARHAAEHALRASEQHLAITLQSIGDAVVTTDAAGVVTAMNPTAERLTGWPLADAMGLPLARVLHLVDARTREAVADPVARALAASLPGAQPAAAAGSFADTALLSRDGHERQIARNAAPIRGPAGTIDGAVLVFSDVSERYAGERALRDSEARLQTVIDHLPDGLLISPLGGPTHWNRAALTIYGLSGEPPRDFAEFSRQFELSTLDGKPLADSDGPIRRLGRGEALDGVELAIARRDRPDWRRVFRYSGARVLDRDGRPVVFLSVSDVTQARQAQAALERSFERLRATGELANVGGWELDVDSGRIEASTELRRLLGLPPGDALTADSLLALYEGAARDTVEAAGRAVLQHGTPWSLEAPIRTRVDRAQRWVRSSGRAVRRQGRTVRVIGAIQDVTDLHESQERARQGEELVQMASGLVRLGGWELDLDAALATWSDALADLHEAPRGTPVPLAQAIGFYQGESRRRIEAAVDTCRRDGTPFDEELALTGAKGSARWVRVIGHPVRDAAGRIAKLRGAMLDVTARKEAELALADQQQNLEALVRERTAELAAARDAADTASRAKSSFLANMSHEIRTPMNAIIGLTHLLRQDAEEPRSRERLGQVDTAAQHLLGVINDILDLSKIEAGRETLDIDDFAIADVVDRTIGLLQQRALDKGLALTREIDPGLPRRLRGDALRLEQVLVNFIGNAIKFSERGRIAVRVRREPELAPPPSAAAANGPALGLGLRIEVSDQGDGLTDEQRDRLFKPFTQADESATRRHGGTGLGLAIVKRLAAMMGGEVGVDSVAGAGSTFWMTARLLPADNAAADGAGDGDVGDGSGAPMVSAAGSAAAGRPDGAPAAAVPDRPLDTPAAAALRERFSGARVLLADDDPVNQLVIEEMLSRLGLRVDVVDGGEQAIHHVYDTDYALVLMDMQMPVVDGLAATRAIREMPGRQTLPIVAITANAFAEDRARCLAAGMNDHLAKPVEPQRLHGCLLRWLTVGQARLGGGGKAAA